MRSSELLHREVLDASGAHVGYVEDIRMEQNGRILGTWGAAFTISGLLVTPRRWTTFLGYDVGHEAGPWILRALVRSARRRARFVPWSAVEQLQDRVVLRVTADQLEAVELLDPHAR